MWCNPANGRVDIEKKNSSMPWFWIKLVFVSWLRPMSYNKLENKVEILLVQE